MASSAAADVLRAAVVELSLAEAARMFAGGTLEDNEGSVLLHALAGDPSASNTFVGSSAARVASQLDFLDPTLAVPLAASAGGAAVSCVLRLLSPVAQQLTLRLAVSTQVASSTAGGAAPLGSPLQQSPGSCVSVCGVIAPWLCGVAAGSGKVRPSQLQSARRVVDELLAVHVLVQVPHLDEKAEVLAVDDAFMAEDGEVCSAFAGIEPFVMLEPHLHSRLWSALIDGEDVSFAASAPVCAVWPRSSKESQKRKPTAAFLDEFVQSTWDNILHFLIGSSQSADALGAVSQRDPPSDLVIELLRGHGLMDEMGENGELLVINSEGFQFLLKDRATQLWELLIRYSRHPRPTADVLSLLLQVSELHVGIDFKYDTCSAEQRSVLDDMMGFGLLWKHRKSDRFYVTPLVSLLRVGIASNHSGTADADFLAHASEYASDNVAHAAALAPSEENGFLVVETNFRVYAYTDSPLKLSLLSLFVKIVYRLPGLVMGLITRDSAREAVRHGISANQIIAFLRQHMHPRARMAAAQTRSPIVPENVSDQLQLWEAERNRVQSVRGLLFFDFETQGLFTESLKYARDSEILLWPLDSEGSEDPMTWKMVIKEDGKALLGAFIKKTKAEQNIR